MDTSCDETAAAVVRDGREALSHVVSSQIPLHRRFGGVVPEIACRAHTENITRVVDRALRDAGVSLGDLGGVAVTNRPGLIGALLVGVQAAKAVAVARGLPLVGVNHVEAHIYSAVAAEGPFPLPAAALVVSGGHTSLFLVREDHGLEELGRTIDDAAGEAFDKAAAILGLGYPGGPAIERAARSGNPRAVDLPRSWLAPGSLDFSFSGLKTALLYHAKGQDSRPGVGAPRPDLDLAGAAASFQEAVVDVLVGKAREAVRRTGVRHLVLGGGVAANSLLRDRLREVAREDGFGWSIPPREYCTDNAVMVGVVGARRLRAGERDGLDLDANSRMW